MRGLRSSHWPAVWWTAYWRPRTSLGRPGLSLAWTLKGSESVSCLAAVGHHRAQGFSWSEIGGGLHRTCLPELCPGQEQWCLWRSLRPSNGWEEVDHPCDMRSRAACKLHHLSKLRALAGCWILASGACQQPRQRRLSQWGHLPPALDSNALRWRALLPCLLPWLAWWCCPSPCSSSRPLRSHRLLRPGSSLAPCWRG